MRLGRAVRRLRVITPLLALLLFAGALPAQSQSSDPAGVLVAYSLHNGKQVWTVKTPGFFATTDVSDTTVAGRSSNCGSGNGTFTAFAASDGKQRWKAPSDYEAISPRGGESVATGADASGVIVVTDLSAVRGLDAKSGAEQWSHRSKSVTAVTVSSELVFVEEVRFGRDDTRTSAVTTYDRETGRKLWSRLLPRSAYPSAAVGRGIVALSSTDNDGSSPVTIVFDAKTGKRRWTAPLATAGIADDVVVMGTTWKDPDPRVEARDVRSGELLWRHELPARGAFTIGDVIVVGSDDNHQVAVDARTGTELAAVPGLVWNGPGVQGAGKDSFAWADADAVHLADTTTGHDRWSAAIPAGFEAVHSVVIGRDAVYISLGCTPSD